jgi:hypothetical protein
MSIRSRIKDAETFWKEERKEEALLAVLSAANDTARKRYPQAKGANEALAHFITDVAGHLGQGAGDTFDWTFRGGISFGAVLHDAYRSLLDTGKLPPDVELTPGAEFQVYVLNGNRRAYSDCLIPRLIEAVKQSPENAADFAKRRR